MEQTTKKPAITNKEVGKKAVASRTTSVKKAVSVTPTEPVRKITPAKVVKTAAALLKPALPFNPANFDLSKPKPLSEGQRIFIQRLKQLARQEGTSNHAPSFQRAPVK